MRRRILAVLATWLLIVGCGALTSSNAADAGGDRGPQRRGDSSSEFDASPDTNGGGASTDGALMCPGADDEVDSGGSWSTHSLDVMAKVYAIGGSGPNDVWAVGEKDSGGAGVIEHWGGSAWSASVVPSTSAGAVRAIHGIWSSGPSDAWAVGAGPGGAGVILHWTGSGWSISSTPSHASLFGIWGSGPSDVWAVGEGAILHWDGSAWSTSPEDSGLDSGIDDPVNALRGVWGSGPSDVWAVGGGSSDIDAGFASRNGIFLHYDGTIWSSLGPNCPAYSCEYWLGFSPVSAWGSGPDDVWAAGVVCQSGHYGEQDCFSDAWHWDGKSWTEESPFPLPEVDACYECSDQLALTGVWSSGPCDVWTVGSESEGPELVLNWTGRRQEYDCISSLAWTDYDVPINDYVGGLFSVWGSGPGDVWVGGDGVIFRYSN
jgi:hypothetical protein